MFDKLFGRFGKPEETKHPFATAELLDKLIAEMPAGDAAQTLTEVAQWIDDVGRFGAEVGALELRQAVLRLDEFSRPAFGELYARFLTPGAAGYLSERSWALLDAHCRYLFGAYRFVLGSAAKDKNLATDKEVLAICAIRGMRAWVVQKKLLHDRYQPVETSWWHGANALLGVARKLKVHKQDQHLYAGDEQRLTTRGCYRVGVYFEMAPVARLNQAQLEALDQFLLHHVAELDMVGEQGAGATHRIDLAANRGPLPLAECGPADKYSRYCSTRRLRAALVELSTELHKQAALPPWLARVRCDLDQAQGMVKALLLHWSDAPPQIESPRREETTQLLAVHGFALTRRMLENSTLARKGNYGQAPKSGLVGDVVKEALHLGHKQSFTKIGADKKQTEPQGPPKSPLQALQRMEQPIARQMEHWTQTDVSATGLGATVPGLSAMVGVGGLCCYRLKSDIEWRLGILRRVERTPDGETSIGIEKLTGSARAASARLGDANTVALAAIAEGEAPDPVDAIALAEGSDQLLLGPGEFQPGRILHLQIDGGSRTVRLVALIDRQDDYQRVRIEPHSPAAS